MKNLYLDTRINDANVREKYFLSEELMMENAASALEEEVLLHCYKTNGFYIDRPHALILCGKGNNGADGWALARRLIRHSLSVTVCSFGEPKTEIGQLQKKRAVKAGVSVIEAYEADSFLERVSIDLTVVIDCVFGAGFHGELPYEEKAVIEEINANEDAYKIACDVPSGLDQWGNGGETVFKADSTVTMGALKLALYSDRAKDISGRIILANLGIDRGNFEYENSPSAFLLEEKELELPFRRRNNVNKGSFGHTAVLMGQKKGAAVIASQAALRFGSGLVTVVTENEAELPYELMQSDVLPENTTAVAVGMGLGRTPEAFERAKALFRSLETKSSVGVVLDADAYYIEEIGDFIASECKNGSRLILTPHPKEFVSLLKNTGFGDYTVKEAVEKRIELAGEFVKKYPGAVLILKGANVIIASMVGNETKIYINSFGTPALSKAGSGDVLTGLCASLLAQGQSALNAAVNASLAHAIASRSFGKSFAMTPFDLIEEVTKLEEKRRAPLKTR